MRYIALFLCALLGSAAALADTPVFQYDYLELAHQNITPDTGASQSGPFGDLSYTFLSGVQVRAGYGHLDLGSGLSRKDYEFGFTGEDGINDTTDLYTDVLYLNYRTDNGSSIYTDDGYRLAIGLRHQAWKFVEADGWVAHNFLTQGSNELGVGVMVQPLSWLGLGVSYAHDSLYANTATIRVRLYF